MKTHAYECLEFQWVEPKHNTRVPAPTGYIPFDKPSVQFNEFSEKHNNEFNVIWVTAMSGQNSTGQLCETLYVMICWH